jgi:hypothetical protein
MVVRKQQPKTRVDIANGTKKDRRQPPARCASRSGASRRRAPPVLPLFYHCFGPPLAQKKEKGAVKTNSTQNRSRKKTQKDVGFFGAFKAARYSKKPLTFLSFFFTFRRADPGIRRCRDGPAAVRSSAAEAGQGMSPLLG